MRWMHKSNRSVSLSGNVYSVLSALFAALLIAVFLLNGYALQKERETAHTARQNILAIYRSQLEDTMSALEKFLENAAITDADFLSVSNSRCKTEAYGAAVRVSGKYQSWLNSQDVISAFVTYASYYDFYHNTWANSHLTFPYAHEDYARIREAVAEQANGKAEADWQRLDLSDRSVFLYAYTFRGTVFATVVDPSMQKITDPDGWIFYTNEDGKPLYPSPFSSSSFLPDAARLVTETGERYDITAIPLPRTDGQLTYITPSVSLWRQMSPAQTVLLVITTCLLATIPVCWAVTEKWLMSPLNSLKQTLQAIRNNDNDTDIRVPENFRLAEANEVAKTVNSMLDTIRKQKIDHYESQLQIQHAQLQYLQLQIRPHFFLNCLNIIYSLAKESKLEPIQELVLHLSVYLRSTFKNSINLVPLKEELRSVESYIHIQQLSMDHPPQLEVDLSADVVEVSVPPLSILSFVENSVKHGEPEDMPMRIQVTCRVLRSEERDFLNITVCDNCGGLSQEKLKELNSQSAEIYKDKNVGISNVRQRLRLIYGREAALTFRNRSNGTCVELFIPLHYEWKGEIQL